jgi:3-hydroxyisobutyrate dehydrogenase
MKLGFLGTGLMGQPMVQKLLEAKLPVIAYNRTAAKLQSLRDAGAIIADSPAAAIRATDAVIVMLTDAQAIQQVLLSAESRSALAGRTVISMSTISPSQSQEIAEAVMMAGGEYLEAPVLGSILEAKEGKLQVMVGSSEPQFQQWLTVLKNFGPEPLWIGPVGTATALKLALNQLIASLMAAFSLSLGFVQRQGVDVEKFLQILRDSVLYAPTFDRKLPRLRDRNFAHPNFPTKHLLKDTDLFLSQAKEVGLNVNSLGGTRDILQKAIDLGLAEADYSAMFAAINPKE